MSFRVKLMRKLTGRPYGIAYIKVGKTHYPKIVRFDRDVIRTKWGTWVIDKDKIYYEKELNSVKMKKEEVFQASQEEKEGRKEFLMADFQEWREGFPVIFLDLMNAEPLHFSTENELFRNATPQNIEATLGKEKAAFEWEVLRKQRSKLMLLMIITVVILVIVMGVSIMNWQLINKIGERVFQLPLQSTGIPT